MAQTVRDGVIFSCRQVLLVALLCVVTPAVLASYDLRLVVQSDWLEDPEQREAVSLLLHLLPPGGHAGLWAYSEAVRPLVAVAEVNSDWRDRALAALRQADGGGDAAVLPAVLEAALASGSVQADGPRALLLIGDGRVKVSDSPMVNAASARALEVRFSTAGADRWPIYTAQAAGGSGDDLLQALARGSGGQVLPSLDSPAATWSRVLAAAIPMTRLPQRNGRVRVPEATRSLAWLIASGTPQLSIQPPDPATARGETRVRFANHRLRRWESPLAGDWRIDGPDADRTTVFAALALAPARRELPVRLRAGDGLEGRFRLLEHGESVARHEAWAWRVMLTGPGGYARSLEPVARPDGLPVSFPALQQPGWYRLELTADHGAERLSWVYWVAVDPAATGSSISTRPPDLPEADLRTAALSLLVFLLLAALVIAWILRRRRRHKLRLWEQRRGRST